VVRHRPTQNIIAAA